MPPSVARLDNARTLLQSGQAERALRLLAAEVAAASQVTPAHALQIEALVALRRRAEANAALDHALTLPAPSADALDALAFFARTLGRHELSNRLYRAAAALSPQDAALQFNLATSERSLGRLTEAAAACENTLRLAPDDLAAVLMRSELTRATPRANNLDDLRARLAADPTERVQMFAAYALGKELHDLSRFDEAFDTYARGAAARRRNLRYDVAEDEAKLSRVAEVFPGDGRAAGPLAPADHRHIFIVGLPRSGTTLTERILGGLPGVTSNGETDNFATALIGQAPPGRADIFQACADADPRSVRAAYEALATPTSPGAATLEKLPLNYLYVGAIARALPDAAIIWVRRHPLDSCLAMFRTLFGEAYPFSYDLADLARYYAAYARLMDHWTRSLPGRLIAVDYEALVADPGRVGADLAARCGLPWTPDALDLTRNRTASLTASAAQVRHAIYGSSAGAWTRYRRQLQPLAERLGALGVDL
ncbi:sulfotransferase [Phenylobacterium sp.]|uniref:tetratricopeptide repeat-containing sulfotransferase family protein n=1 Tax=Phenylobacterium sp. TaxID=1871053 RepID=UPI002869FC61|nr:sulfotransferase [Phenylobacterium sp.]